jgi:ABC-type glycerol-3-phosphate transport system substrate-binding protein
MILFAVLSIGAMAGVSGCGSGGFFGATSTSGKYTITVTATSADLVRTSTVQLTIQ